MKFISTTTALSYGSLLSVANAKGSLPEKFFDPHHHFYDTNEEWATYLRGLLGNVTYSPEEYTKAVIEPIEAAGVDFSGSVIVEALPTDGVEEVKWLQAMIDDGRYGNAKAIVGSCDLSQPDADACLANIKSASSLVTGLRWLLQPAHSQRVNGSNLLQDAAFQAGYETLADYDLTWDLQCDPDQIPAFYQIAKSNPDTPVCINHMGRLVAWPADATEPNQVAISEWRTAMSDMASLGNTYVKISMLGHMVPDWIADPDREELVRDLVLEMVDLFGVERCMVNTNWWMSADVADSDFAGTVGPEPVQLLEKTGKWFDYGNYSNSDQEWLYWKSAETFYLRKDYTVTASPTDGSTSASLGWKFAVPVVMSLFLTAFMYQ